MSKRYPGNFITGNPVALSQSSNTGVWDLKDQFQATNSNTWQEADGIYEIGRSLRFRASASAYLTRTVTVASNNTTNTASFWVKRGKLGIAAELLFTYNAAANYHFNLQFDTNNKLAIYEYNSAGAGSFNWELRTTQFFRDPNAWYHIVVALDTTQTISTNRVKVYVNGSQVTAFSTATYPSLNYTLQLNKTAPHYIGVYNGGALYQYDGLLAEYNYIDGQQLDSSYFGYTDSITNIWQPKRYTGAYGNNGFYLPFNQYTSPRMLGKNYNSSNLLTYSEQLDNAVWAKPAAAVAPVVNANQIVAPDGTLTADLVTFAGATTHPVLQEVTVPSFTVGDTYTASIYLKTSVAGRYNLQLVYFLTAGGNQDGYCQVTFNSSGVLTFFQPLYTANVSCTAVNVGNGWYRVSVTHKWTTGGAGTTIRMSVGQDSGASSIYAWGAQINLGEGPDAYLPTVASAVNQSFTPSNISVTAGVTYDSMVDSPTNVFTTATDVGGTVPGNYPTWDPLIAANYNNTSTLGSTIVTLSNGNLTDSVSANTGFAPRMSSLASFGFPSSGKWYWEVTGLSSNSNTGIARGQLIVANGSGSGMDATVDYGSGYSNISNNITGTANGTPVSYTDTDIIGIAFDAGASSITWYKNNVYVCGFTNLVYTGTENASNPWRAYRGLSSSSGTGTSSINFGQRPFTYAPPAGFKSLNTTNIQALGTSEIYKAAITPHKWMDSTLYGGIGTTQKITNSGEFAPDLVWVKSRSAAFDNIVQDSVRGAGIASFSNLTNVEVSGIGFSSFNSNGFTLSGTTPDLSNGGSGFVGWQWKQSPTAGFNIVPYTGNGSNMSISHNLGVAPKMIMIKERTSISNWIVQHNSLGWDKGFLGINNSATTTTSVNFSNNTAPTSSNFTVGGYSYGDGTNTRKYIAYLWAEVPGFSKFGSYMGNGSTDGPFVHLGFKPKWIMIKNATSVEQWSIIDISRYPYNDNTAHILFPNASSVEDLNASYHQMDFLSNGIKIRTATPQQLINTSNNTYIYAAFAESPFGLNNRAR